MTKHRPPKLLPAAEVERLLTLIDREAQQIASITWSLLQRACTDPRSLPAELGPHMEKCWETLRETKRACMALQGHVTEGRAES